MKKDKKLDTIGFGGYFLAAAAVLAGAGILLDSLGCERPAALLLGAAGLVFVVLLVILFVEHVIDSRGR